MTQPRRIRAYCRVDRRGFFRKRLGQRKSAPRISGQADEVAPAQLAADRRVEEREVTRTVGHLEMHSDRPDMLRLQSAFLADAAALVPSNTLRAQGRKIANGYHETSHPPTHPVFGRADAINCSIVTAIRSAKACRAESGYSPSLPSHSTFGRSGHCRAARGSAQGQDPRSVRDAGRSAGASSGRRRSDGHWPPRRNHAVPMASSRRSSRSRWTEIAIRPSFRSRQDPKPRCSPSLLNDAVFPTAPDFIVSAVAQDADRRQVADWVGVGKCQLNRAK